MKLCNEFLIVFNIKIVFRKGNVGGCYLVDDEVNVEWGVGLAGWSDFGPDITCLKDAPFRVEEGRRCGWVHELWHGSAAND